MIDYVHPRRRPTTPVDYTHPARPHAVPTPDADGIVRLRRGESVTLR